jgi:hypothetical protein
VLHIGKSKTYGGSRKEACYSRCGRTDKGVSTTVAKPPKLCGPHIPVIVLKTSDGYACVLYNLKSLSGVLGKPESSTFYNSHRINKGVTITLQHLIQNLHQSAEEFKTVFYI